MKRSTKVGLLSAVLCLFATSVAFAQKPLPDDFEVTVEVKDIEEMRFVVVMTCAEGAKMKDLHVACLAPIFIGEGVGFSKPLVERLTAEIVYVSLGETKKKDGKLIVETTAIAPPNLRKLTLTRKDGDVECVCEYDALADEEELQPVETFLANHFGDPDEDDALINVTRIDDEKKVRFTIGDRPPEA